MALYNVNTPAGINPPDFGALVLDGLATESTALRSGVTVVRCDSNKFYVPRVVSDPTAVWALEGESLVIPDPGLSESVADMRKVGGAITVSRELAEDSQPSAVQIVGQSITRSLAVAIDNVFFTNAGANAKAPKGLPAVTGVHAISGAATSLDPFVDALVAISGARNTGTAFYMSGATYLRIAKIRTASGSAQTLITPDGREALGFTILGVPVYIADEVPLNTVWCVDTTKVLVVIRSDIRVETDKSVKFATDEVMVKATARLDILAPSPKAIAKVTLAA